VRVFLCLNHSYNSAIQTVNLGMRPSISGAHPFDASPVEFFSDRTFEGNVKDVCDWTLCLTTSNKCSLLCGIHSHKFLFGGIVCL